jgi:hypothetical protein
MIIMFGCLDLEFKLYSALLEDAEHKSIVGLSRLVSAVTNMTIKQARWWQVVNSGLGGVHEVNNNHIDVTVL